MRQESDLYYLRWTKISTNIVVRGFFVPVKLKFSLQNSSENLNQRRPINMIHTKELGHGIYGHHTLFGSRQAKDIYVMLHNIQ